MSKWKAGFLAGLAATVVLSLMMVVKNALGVMPELRIITMLADMLGVGRGVAWLVHFGIGVFAYGTAIALLGNPDRRNVTRGLAIGAAGWLAMMVAIMPMAGAGLFGLALGWLAPAMTLVLHLMFGAVLGWTFDRLVAPRAGAAHGGAAPHPTR